MEVITTPIWQANYIHEMYITLITHTWFLNVAAQVSEYTSKYKQKETLFKMSEQELCWLKM